MTLLRMRASFGCLQNAELTLSPGLNVLTLPNESGKSTWVQFLLAMFYGIDTAERAKAGSIPAKTKYKPWSGAPMAGEIELDWNGRTIILERTSRGRVPMGQFRAYEKASGLPIPELTAENCGKTLFGVERSVFERSAFVRQLGLAVSADDALERRLSSLVTTGEETVSAAETARRLRERKNRLRHNKTGLIPDAQQQLSAVEDALARHQAAAQQQQSLRARQQTLSAQREDLLEIQSGLEILADRQKLQQKTNAQSALIDANNRLAGAQARTAKLPPRETLEALRSRIRAVDALEIPPAPPAPPPAPDCPEAFRGVPEDRLLEQAARDGREFDRLTSLRRRPAVWDLLGFLIFTVAAIFAAILPQFLPLALPQFLRVDRPGEPLICAVFAALALACLLKFVLDLRHNRKYEAQLSAADALLTRYARRSRDEFTTFAAEYATKLSSYRESCKQFSISTAQRQRLLDEKARQTAQLIGSAAMLSTGAYTASARAPLADTSSLRSQNIDAPDIHPSGTRTHDMYAQNAHVSDANAQNICISGTCVPRMSASGEHAADAHVSDPHTPDARISDRRASDMCASGVHTLDDAARAVAAALAAWDGLDAAKQTAAQAQAQYDAVSAALADIAERPLPTRDLSAYTPAAVRAELLRADMEAASIQSRLDQNRGALAALGDPAALAAERERLASQIRALEEQYAAIELAEGAVQDAAAEMQRRFAPALAEQTGEIFAALTGGRYDRMLLDRQMDVMAGETAEPVLRPGGYLSAGTQDALYLALRLAVCRLALPAGTPIVLDDALVCFDDERLRRALDMLRKEAETRQILLFSCQGREQQSLQAN